MKNVLTLIKMRRRKDGKVVKEFHSFKEAAVYLGNENFGSTICRVCRRKTLYKGYYWQSQKVVKKRKNFDEQVVGKRVYIRRSTSDDECLDGKIKEFDPTTGKHEVLFDCGITEHFDLDNTEYKLKNDQGQKPIEKLDLKSGEVLA